MLTREQFEQLSDDEKFDHLFRLALAAKRASDGLATTLQLLQDRVAKIQAQHPGSAS
jgi:hypothetical protein